MGQIAVSGHPDALDLFRQVMLASASIPVAFPPVFFDVEAAGRRYDEMHVDGSVAARMFYTAGVFSFPAASAAAGRGSAREDVYVIHNGQLLPTPEPTTRSLRAIATRVFESSGKAAAIGDLFRIYAVTTARGGGLPLGHDPGRRRDHRRRSLRSREDDRALRDRISDRERGPAVVDRPTRVRRSLDALTEARARRSIHGRRASAAPSTCTSIALRRSNSRASARIGHQS